MPTYHALSGFSAADVGAYSFPASTGTTYAATNTAEAASLCHFDYYQQSGYAYATAARVYQDGDTVIFSGVSGSVSTLRATLLATPQTMGTGWPLLCRYRVRFRLSEAADPVTTTAWPRLRLYPSSGFGGINIEPLQLLGRAVIWRANYINASGSSRVAAIAAEYTDGAWHTLELIQTVAGAADGRWELRLDDELIDTVRWYLASQSASLLVELGAADAAEGALRFEVCDFDIWQTMPEDGRRPYAEVTPEAGGILSCAASVSDGRSVAGYEWDDGTTGASRAISADGYYSCAVTDSEGDTITAGYYVVTARDIYTAAWSTGETSRIITVDASGVYTYTVTNAAGSASDTVTVAFPVAGLPEFVGDPVPVGHWTYGSREALVYRTGLATVQSQYAASPRILALAAMYWELMDPADAVNLMIKRMIDPQTAEGYGLDVWGRIVGIRRSLVPADGRYLAYEPPAGDNDEGDSWNNAPFNPLTAQGLAPDATFRVYVFVKAMLNIGNGSLASLNRYFSLLFPDSGIKVIHPGTMIIRVLDYEAALTEADVYALKGIDWVPAGVGWQLWQGEPVCFGFDGSGLQPFDQAPFMNDGALQFM